MAGRAPLTTDSCRYVAELGCRRAIQFDKIANEAGEALSLE